MGRRNEELIRSAVEAKKTYGANSMECFQAEALVTQSQAACPHADVRQSVATRTSKKVKQGDVLRWCVDCALPIEINDVPWAQVHPPKRPN